MNRCRRAWEAAKAMRRDPNGIVMKLRTEAQKDFNYFNDPNIPEHEKDLQMALDEEVFDPMPLIEHYRELYDHWCKTGDLPGDDMYEMRSIGDGTGSLEEYVEFLKEAISEENVKLSLQEYEEYLALRKEAIEKGFVKGGYGRKRGDV